MPKKRLSPHDRFIRSMMSYPKVVSEFFDAHLPEKVKQALDLSSIKPQRDSFIDDKLRLQIADVLFEVSINDAPGYVYLLLEHASTPDKLLPFRMLKYMVAIQDHHLKKHKTKKLPFVYPIILYTGSRAYNHSMDLFDLFGDQKDLAKETWSNPYSLIDLTQRSDEDLQPYLWFGTMALFAKHVHDPDILPFLKNVMSTLRRLENEGEKDYIYTIVSYVIEAGEVPDRRSFTEVITKGLKDMDEEKVMTLAQQWKKEGFDKGMQQGMEQGMQQGMEQGMQQIALNMLEDGMPLSKIISLTNLSEKDIKTLKKKIN